MLTEEMKPTPPSAIQVPAADVKTPPPEGSSIVHQAYPLKQPEEEINEFMVQVRGSVLRRARQKLWCITTTRFPWPEVLLGLSMLAIGAILGAVASGVVWNSGKAVVFYMVLPVVAGCSIVAYALLRIKAAQNPSSVARDLLEELPDPDRTK